MMADITLKECRKAMSKSKRSHSQQCPSHAHNRHLNIYDDIQRLYEKKEGLIDVE
jgi:hypothetical protein